MRRTIPRYALVFLFGAVSASHAGAAPSASVLLWVADPVALSSDIEATELRQIGAAVRQALAEVTGAEVTYGRDSLLPKDVSPSAARARADEARKQLNRGEELYMAFEFARGAAALAEAAGLLSAVLADLSPEELEHLYRARLLEGVAWMESGRKDAAAAAFKKLLTLRPDFDPDPQLLPPRSRVVFERSRDRIFSGGVATVAVESTPPDADVLIDGRPRGTTPTTIPNIPLGSHGLFVRKKGYRPYSKELLVTAAGRVERRITLEPTALLAALARVEAAAKKGQTRSSVSDDLALLASSSGAQAIVLVAVERRNGTLVTSALRWAPGDSVSAIVAVGDPAGPADLPRLASLLVEGTWPAEQIPDGTLPVIYDFERAILGLAGAEGTAPAAEPGLLSQWWFWTIVGVAVVGGGATAGYLLTRESEPALPDRTLLQVRF